MSARAIRKLREDRATAASLAATEEEDDDESEEELVPARGKNNKSAFAMMNDSSSSSSSSDEEEDDGDGGKDEKAKEEESAPDLKDDEEEGDDVEDDGKDENLDALLEEFKEQDDKKQSAKATGGDSGDGVVEKTVIVPPTLLQGFDSRDLDVDYVMRTALISADPEPTSNSNSNKNRRRNRQTFLFGNPRDLNVNAKPPHLVGGGMGMSTYDRETNLAIPWPYCNINATVSDNNVEAAENPPFLNSCAQDRKRWYTFLHSDSYEQDCTDFQVIKNSGDTNGLVWFIVHHPFVTRALVTLSMMLYHANQAQEGLTFLRRSVWVYESATLAGFTSRVFDDQCYMDGEIPENKTYFDSLFNLARVNNIAGLPRSSFAISRYLLSLDPLRDPRGILLALDCYAMAVTGGEGNDQWLVDLVENKAIQLHYRDSNNNESTTKSSSDSAEEYRCDLMDFPNWSYSYALALFRLNDCRPCDKANDALKVAINRFPGIVDLLLSENDIDITSRSCRLDWQSVMDYTGSRSNIVHGSKGMEKLDPVVRMATEKAVDLITRIFAKLNHKQWASDAVMLWLFTNLEELKKANTNATSSSTGDDNKDDDDEWKEIPPLSPALMKYSQVDPSEYEMKFQLLPAEAIAMDPRVVQHALVIDPNRGRLLRQRRGNNNNNNNNDLGMAMNEMWGNAVRPNTNVWLGPPTQVIDLDWPMLEIFWRSLLPWNRIDEIPRPRR